MKKVSVILLTLMLMLSCAQSALAAGDGNNYGHGGLPNAATQCGYAANCWKSLGKTSATYTGANFTKTRFRDNAKLGDFLFADTHGNVGLITDSNGAYIYASEINSSRGTNWYKLVVINACYSGNDSSLPGAFGIGSADTGHAYVGWVGCIADTNNLLTSWTNWFFSYASSLYTIGNSCYYAKQKSGFTGTYKIYGASGLVL